MNLSGKIEECREDLSQVIRPPDQDLREGPPE
jgi:hypothetical protein